MLIIGELINCTRKKVGEAAAKRTPNSSRNWPQAGECRGGRPRCEWRSPGQEVEVLSWLVNVVQEVVDIPCASTVPTRSLRLALPLCKKRAMINSVSDEPARLALIPVLKEHNQGSWRSVFRKTDHPMA